MAKRDKLLKPIHLVISISSFVLIYAADLLLSENESLKQKIEEIEVLHEEIDKSLMSENSSLQSKLIQLQKTLKEVEASKNEAVDVLQKERDDLCEKLEILGKQYQLLERQRIDEESQFQAIVQLEREEKEQVLNRTSKAEAELESVSEEFQQLRKNYEEEKAKVTEMTQAIKEQLRREISVKGELQTSREELEACKTSIVSLQLQLENSHEASQKETELIAIRSECEQLNNIISELREKVRLLEEEKQQTEGERSRLEQDLEATRSSEGDSTKEIEHLKATVSTLREELHEQEKRVQEVLQGARESNNEAEALRKEVTTLQAKLTDSERLLVEASTSAPHTIEPLMMEIEALRSANKRLTTTEERQKQEIEERDSLLDAMRSELEKAENISKEKEGDEAAEFAGVKEECKRHKLELERLTALAQTQATELSNLKEDLLNSEFVVNEHKAQLESSYARCEEVEAKLAESESSKGGNVILTQNLLSELALQLAELLEVNTKLKEHAAAKPQEFIPIQDEQALRELVQVRADLEKERVNYLL